MASQPNSVPGPVSVSVSIPKIAQLIDHALLHPTLIDTDLAAGFALARDLGVATVCVPPYAVPLARAALASPSSSSSSSSGHRTAVCTVIGFPHGTSSTASKLAEATEALRDGAVELDAVVNPAKVLAGAWHYIEHEVEALNRVARAAGARLKLILETDYLADHHVVRLCEICTALRVAFVKTSTGFALLRRADGSYAPGGATVERVALMRRHAGPDVQVKASGGVRTLDQVLRLMSLGVTRVGTSATQAILDEAKARGIGAEEVQIEVGPAHEW